jgi:superfamily II RNA helicase
MVKIISTSNFNSKDVSQKTLDQFSRFSFPLDDFQKHAITCIDNGSNILVTSHTGCGKSLCAEYGIMKCLDAGKKIIFTSPIKSLSNQKFSEFKAKFGTDSVGIITGDVKFQPHAPLIVMTTEILRNMLVRTTQHKIGEFLPTSMDIDMINIQDVDIVIFDEVHYINDQDRGKVWEECIIMLPKHIQLIMLSATIDRAENFAAWIEQVRARDIAVISTLTRHVPLNHYYFYYLPLLRGGGDKDPTNTLSPALRALTNKLVPVYDITSGFHGNNLTQLQRVVSFIKNKKVYTSHASILGAVVKFLVDNNLCPAIFFIFSRRKCEQYVEYITQYLITPAEQAEVERIIAAQLHKIPNHERYTRLESFVTLKKQLMRGVAVHSSALLPIFKELVEILFSKGLVRVLFATETMAIGINMPTKTVLFTSLQKYDGHTMRPLLTHEYTQMSGRAGRRGIDTVGHVIHLPNFFDVDIPAIKDMICGKTQHIISKFNIDYNFVLNSLASATNDGVPSIVNKSLLYKEFTDRNVRLSRRLLAINSEIDAAIPFSNDEIQQLEEYKLQAAGFKLSAKQKKRIATISRDRYNQYLEYTRVVSEKHELSKEVEFNNQYISHHVDAISEVLKLTGFLTEDNNKSLTIDGIVASSITDCNPLLLTRLILRDEFRDLAVAEIAAVLSIFLDTKIESNVGDCDLQMLKVTDGVKLVVQGISKLADKFVDYENRTHITTGTDWVIHLGMMETAHQWGSGIELADLKLPVYIGNFIKDMIKINDIARALENIGEHLRMDTFVEKMRDLQQILVRDVVSVESLYIL